MIRRLLNAPGKWVTSSLARAARLFQHGEKVNYTLQALGPGGRGCSRGCAWYNAAALWGGEMSTEGKQERVMAESRAARGK